MTQATPITVAYGDGIGPEIMQATLKVLEAAGAKLTIETIAVGEELYKKGILTGIEDSAWESLRRTKVFLKAPITTPQGGGMKSLNVTIRKALGLYANVRPCVAYSPYVVTKHPTMDLVIVRENEEDLYGGIEYQQTPEVVQALKLITRPGCERIVRYAFEYAKQNGRKKVTCMTKDNIMKLADGLFHKVFDEIAKEYPEIETEHLIIDIGTARVADTPELFDVIVLPNLYGDILSDVAAQITGSVGLGGSSNVGEHCAMFEAIHGSAPTIAGKNIANPSGLLLGAVMMLVHIGQAEAATKIHNAWLKTLEDGVHTVDIFNQRISTKEVGTKEFAEAVIERLGQTPTRLKVIEYQAKEKCVLLSYQRKTDDIKRDIVGVDIFVYKEDGNADDLAKQLQQIATNKLQLKGISNRGASVWPNGMPETFCTDQWRCRFKTEKPIENSEVLKLLHACDQAGIDFGKVEYLYDFNGKPVYSLGQGEN